MWHKQARSGRAAPWLVVLCLALVSVAATAQVLHFHVDQLAGTAKHCPICPALHSVVPLAHSVHLDFSLQTTAFLAASIVPHRQSVATSFALLSRPPPLA
ncbi:MAG TPA: hypothetical protein VI685_25805 [Candidatus Angelobacter sp.]